MEGALEITGITIVALAAMICGMVLSWLRQPPIVGYIFAGIILGPTGFGLVEDRNQVQLLAELGVLMLLYFIGMELSLRSFRRMWRLAILTTLMQIGASTAAMLLLMQMLDWPLEQAVLFGFVLALSSTAVAVRMLQDIGELRTRAGRITVGVLIAQDLAVAPMLLIVGGMAGGTISYWVFVKVAVAIAILTGVILFLSRRRKINLLFANLMATKPDLAPLMALCGCFGMAAVAGLSGLSPPFGAFLAGLIVGNSAQRQIVYQLAKPIESILMMVFFLSIGLLIDLPFLWQNIAVVLTLWAFVAVFKTALNMGVLHLLGERWQVAFLSSVILAQVGEFSFVLGAAAIDRAIIDTDIYRLIVAVTVLSLVTSPIYMLSARRIQRLATNRVDSLKDLLRLVYFREWILTLRATALVVNATQKTASAARALATRQPKSSDQEEAAASPVEGKEAAPPAEGASEPADSKPEKKEGEEKDGEAKNDGAEPVAALASTPDDGADKTEEQETAEQEPAQSDAGLRSGTADGRSGRGGRRGRTRPVGRTGRRRSDGH